MQLDRQESILFTDREWKIKANEVIYEAELKWGTKLWHFADMLSDCRFEVSLYSPCFGCAIKSVNSPPFSSLPPLFLKQGLA